MQQRYFIVFFLACSLMISAQHASQYWVYFSDKGNTDSAFTNPYALLSQRAVERRARQFIPFDKLDVPVVSDYVEALQASHVYARSRWLNAALVSGIDSSVVANLHFVDVVTPRIPMKKHLAEDAGFTYGQSALQIEMLKGDYIHDRGYTGQGVLIAVFDGGFNNTNTISPFSHLWQNGQIKGIYSFVNQDTNIYFPGSHGTHVLSVLAAKNEGVYVGTAPDADYWLFMTEDEVREVNAEEYNWLAAAEMSDSLGVDVINSSLGYSVFDPGQISYSLNDLDGRTSVVSQAAQFAARKGILVVNSAGNSGSDPNWQKILMPADADSILAVGAVDATEQRSLFSSVGPTVDGRIKPDVMAMGDQARYLTTSGFPTQGNGTSFASPLIAGLAACLRQAYPNHSTENLRQTILQSADQYLSPDSLRGYGLPNFDIALNNIVSVDEFTPSPMLTVYPNPVVGTLNITLQPEFVPTGLKIFNNTGQMIYNQLITSECCELRVDVNHLPTGSYLLYMYNGQTAHINQFIKHGN